jgi:PhnB protein
VGATQKRRAAGGNEAATRKRRRTGKTAGPEGTPSVIPMISYEDGIGALEWLAKAFGFRETARLTAPDGRLSHGEMRAGDGLIMLASPTPDYRGPKRHREACEQARRWSTVPWIIDGVLVYVDHLERHLARAKAAGATILSEIEEGPPGRRYRAEDLEGHRWFFFEKEHG